MWKRLFGLQETPRPTANRGYQAETEGNFAKAEGIYNGAAKEGSVRALFYLGMLHLSGHTQKPDKEEGERLIRSAADRDDTEALYHLGVGHFYGSDRPVNISEGLRFLTLAADHGHEASDDKLMEIYQERPELVSDSTALLLRCQNGAERGHSQATLFLARAYQKGLMGLERWVPEAIKLFEAAGKRGLSVAYFELAIIFESGEGVPQNYPKAQFYYELATKSTHVVPDYQFRFANLLQKMGNKVGAHVWLNLASANRSANSEQVASFITARDELAVLMSPDEVAEAQRIAAEKFADPYA